MESGFDVYMSCRHPWQSRLPWNGCSCGQPRTSRITRPGRLAWKSRSVSEGMHAGLSCSMTHAAHTHGNLSELEAPAWQVHLPQNLLW